MSMAIKDSRVAVTGGAGFIGSHLVDLLMAAGNSVLVIDDLSSGELGNLARWNNNSDFTFVQADVVDEGAMMRLLKDVDYVFHLATRNVRLSLRRPSEVHEVNVTGTLNVLKAAAAGKAQRFLYCSSSEVNGTAEIVPLPEDYHFRPETIYGASKLAGEYYSLVFHRAGWLPVVVARPHNNYGPRAHFAGHAGEVIPRFILWSLAGRRPVIYGDGQQTRDFTYVEETADYLARLLACDAALGGVFNVCRGQEASVREIASLIGELTGLQADPQHLPGRPSDVLRLWGDPSRLREVLGDSPGLSLREGLRRTVAWYREHVPFSAETLASMEPQTWSALEAEPWLLQAETGRGPAAWTPRR